MTIRRALLCGAVASLGLIACYGRAIAGEAIGATPMPGAQAYRGQCASCHGEGLGGGFGPPLRDASFRAKWGATSSEALAAFIRGQMPPGNPNSLPAPVADQLAAFLRVANDLPASGPARTGAATAAAPPVRPQDGPARAARARLDAVASRLTLVSEGQLQALPADDWLAWRGDRGSLGYSRLKQIDRSNVSGLRLAWSLSLGPGSNAIAPLVHDGVMFVHGGGAVRAIDARSGDTIWSYARTATSTRVPLSQPRGIALDGQTVFAPTVDNHMLALDARTGKLLWDHRIGQPDDRIEITGAPVIAHGKVIQGIAGCQGDADPGGCFIVALDSRTGDEVWRFQTIARPGQPGGDSWNGAPVDKRFGSSVWTAGSYDPDLNLVYFGTGQTYVVSTLLNGRGADEPADALYTNSTLALNPDTGKLVWYYQHFPGDVWDLDWAFERTLVTLPTSPKPTRALVTIGKLGIIDALDAATGRYLWSHDLGLQNLVTAIDPVTGRKRYDHALIPDGDKAKIVCPYSGGGRNWPATSYDPERSLLFIPLMETCMAVEFRPNEFGETKWTALPRPDSDGNYGRVTAIDLRTRKILWTNRRRAPEASAMLATAGGLLFDGSRDRWFRALDSSTGRTLWQARLNDTPNSFPITFVAGGRQYVAVVTGAGTPLDTMIAKLTPEIEPSVGTKTLWVFALGE